MNKITGACIYLSVYCLYMLVDEKLPATDCTTPCIYCFSSCFSYYPKHAIMSTPTTGQLRAFATIPVLTGSLSLAGFIIIICMISRSHLRFTTTFHRIMLGVASSDVLQSLWLGLSSIPVPKETGLMYAIGNQNTCNIQGFVGLLGSISVTFYFCGLSGFYLLVIKFGISDEHVKKYYEPIVHFVSIGSGIIGAIFVSIHHGGFYSSGNTC